jgi:hypothetical protein
MREYRLTEVDVRLSDVGEVDSKEYRITRRPIWDRQISAIVARAFGVRPLDVKHWCKTAGRVVARAKFVGVTPAPQIAMYAYEALLAKLTAARREYVSQVRAGQRRNCYSPETAGNHFALAWVSAVYGKIQDLVPRGEEDTALPNGSSGRDLIAVEAQDKALIEQYLAGKEIDKARKATGDRAGPRSADCRPAGRAARRDQPRANHRRRASTAAHSGLRCSLPACVCPSSPAARSRC